MRALVLLPLLGLAACAGPADGGDLDTEVGLDDTDVVETDAWDSGDTALPADSDAPTDWPESPDDYPFDVTTYLSSLVIPGVDRDGTPTCCRDFGAISRDAIEAGTSLRDNAVARFGATLGAFFDLQAELDAQVEEGTVAILLDHHALPPGDGTYDLALFVGEFATGTTWDDASFGEGEFWAWETSFVGGSGRPATLLRGATVTGDRLVASGSRIDFPIPLVGASLIVPARDVRIDARIRRDATGISLRDGELSGYVELDDFYDAYNHLAASSCACAGLSGPLFSRTPSGWVPNCVDSAELVDSCGYYGICPYLLGDSLFGPVPGFCGFVAPLIPSLADLDLDGDPSDYEAFSVGLRISGVPGDVVGVVPPPF